MGGSSSYGGRGAAAPCTACRSSRHRGMLSLDASSHGYKRWQNFRSLRHNTGRMLSAFAGSHHNSSGEKATQEDLDSSPDFHLRQAVDETHPPTVIGEHWIDHLDNEGCIAKCKPHNFKFEDKWLPLYTRAGVTKQVSGLGSLLNTQGDSPLIAVIPPESM